MPGQLKEVRNKIKSIQNMQQITKAMKMVSAAKLGRAQDAIVQMRPYVRKLQEALSLGWLDAVGKYAGREHGWALQRRKKRPHDMDPRHHHHLADLLHR